MLQEPSDVGKARLQQVFEYLRALNELRNPARRVVEEQPWHYWIRDLPTHSSIQVGTVRSGSSGEDDGGGDFILRVQRPDITYGPRVPDELADWVSVEDRGNPDLGRACWLVTKTGRTGVLKSAVGGTAMAAIPEIIPLTNLRQDAAAVVKRLQASHEPIIITQRGRAAAILMSVHAYEQVLSERKLLMELARADQEISAGVGYDLDTVLAGVDALLAVE